MNTQQTSIPVKVLPFTEIKQKAFARRGLVDPQSNDLTARIVVNFIRHELTPYDALMTKAHFNQARQETVRQAVYTAIARTYAHVPAIVRECERQMRGATAEELQNKAYRSGRAQ